jgi:hypothetical protein
MTLSTVLEGVALTLLGDAETGLSMTDKGIELYLGMTAPVVLRSLLLHLRGLVHSYLGHPDRGLALIGVDGRRNISAVDRVGATEFTIT